MKRLFPTRPFVVFLAGAAAFSVAFSPLCALRATAAPDAAPKSDYIRLRDAMTKDAAQGATATKEWLATGTNGALITRARIQRLLALTYLSKLNDAKSALAVLDAGMAQAQQAKADPDQQLAQATLLIAKARILTS